MSHATPAGPSPDRNLLFGILAVQMDFVTRDALIAAMHARVLAKHRPLGDLLLEQGALSSQRRALLDAMADAHVQARGGDLQRSLAAVGHRSTLGDAPGSVADPELQASLAATREAAAASAVTVDARPALTGGARYEVLRPYAPGWPGARLGSPRHGAQPRGRAQGDAGGRRR